MKPTMRITSANLASRGFKPASPAQAPRPEPAKPEPQPVRVEAPLGQGIAAAIESLRDQIAAMPPRPRPAGMDMTLRRNKAGSIEGATITFNWS